MIYSPPGNSVFFIQRHIEGNFTIGGNVQTLKTYFKISAVVLSVFFIMPACKTRHVDPRYTEAEALTADWCIQTQLDVSGLKADSRQYIQMTSFDTYQGLMTKYPKYDNTSIQPIVVISYISKMTNDAVMTAPKEISKESMCKCVAVANLREHKPDALTNNAADGTCRQMNEQALAWALSKLTDRELARYNRNGKKLDFSGDMISIGSAFYGTCSEFDTTDNYTLSSAAQMLPYINSDPLTGSHYCKLISPAQALFWVLNRAYWKDPLGKGPEKGDNASLACDIETPSENCMLNVEPSGSCIFHLGTANMNMCIDYTGKDYVGGLSDNESGQSNCASRSNSHLTSRYSTDSCATRSDLDNGTGFEKYKGMCVRYCGDVDKEYRMNTYNNPSIGTPAEGCPLASGMWYPAVD